jgi:hypothetical protein
MTKVSIVNLSVIIGPILVGRELQKSAGAAAPVKCSPFAGPRGGRDGPGGCAMSIGFGRKDQDRSGTLSSSPLIVATSC